MPELVGLGVQPVDMMGKLSTLLTIRQQRAQVQQEEQNAEQRKNIAAYDWNKHLGEDGTLDVESFARDGEARIIFGDQYIPYLEKASVAKQQQLAAKSSLMTLRTDQRKRFAEMMTALRSDSDVAADNETGRQKVNAEMIRFGELYGEDALPVLSAYAPGLKRVPPKRMVDALAAIGLQAADADRQVEMQKPQFANTGGALKDVNPLTAGGPAEDIKLTIPPGAVAVQDANGRTFFVNPQAPGNARAVGAGGGGPAPRSPKPAPSADPNAPTFVQPVPGQKDLEDHVAQVRKADTDYGVNRHVNDELLRLSGDTTTGPGTKTWHKVLGSIAGFTHIGTDAVSDFQKIGAYLDRQAALSAQQMGLPETNAGLATAANLSGTTDYAPEALQTKVRLTDAMVEGAHQYRKGLDKVIGTGPNQDLSKLQEFRAQWADNFDPYVFRVENALRRGDKAELAQIREEIGSNGMAALKQKSENLRKLEAGELLQ